MSNQMTHSYGLSSNFFVSRKVSGDSIIVGGTAQDASRWTRVLTQRAAQMLWFHLVQYLFPEKSEMVSAMVSTAPLRSSDMPTITTHVTVEKLETGSYEVIGWVGNLSWLVQIAAPDAQKLWTALDIALYPVGWQGSKTK
jgi:hypothetical protein